MALTAAVAVALAGCDALSPAPTQASPAPEPAVSADLPGRVAILDMQAVATRLGRDAEINEALAARQARVREKLQELRTDLGEQLLEQLDTLAEEDPENLDEARQQLRSQAQARLDEVVLAARERLEQERERMLLRSLEEVKPVARKVAAERGFDIVTMQTTAFVLVNEPEVEITDAVVAAMIAQRPPRSPEASASNREPDDKATADREPERNSTGDGRGSAESEPNGDSAAERASSPSAMPSATPSATPEVIGEKQALDKGDAAEAKDEAVGE